MAEFTKEELLDIIRIQQTTATQLEAIVGILNTCGDRQIKILSHLENGIGNKIIDSLDKGCSHCRKNIDDIKRDVLWLKIFLGLIGIAAFVSFIIKIFHH